MGLFRSFDVLMKNIAQIVIVVILIPFLAIICFALSPQNSSSAFGSFAVSLIGEIPLCSLLCTLISQYIGSFSAVAVADITLLVILRAFPEALLVSISVNIFNSLFSKEWGITGSDNKKVLKPLPILPSFLGIAAATLLVQIFDLTQNNFIVLVSEIVTLAIIIFAIKLMFSGRYSGFLSGRKIVEFIIGGVYAILLSIYIAVLLLTVSGAVGNVWQSTVFVYTTTFCIIGIMFMLWLLENLLFPKKV